MSRQKNAVFDMTVGSPIKVILKFSLPMLLSMVFQQLYNIMDSVIAGHFIGVGGLAAVGASFPITSIFVAVATGAAVGSSVVISQLFGAKEMVKLRSSISTTLISLSVLGAILTVIAIFICSPLLQILKTPSDIMPDSVEYLRIFSGGILFVFVYNASTAVFNALGDSKTPLWLLIFSVLLNVALNLLFTIVFKMGVAGLAWATFIAQGCASVVALIILLFRVKRIKIETKYKIFDFLLLKKIAKNAIPSIMQQSFVSVGQLFIQGLVNSYGTIVMAGYSSAIKINVFVVMSLNTLSSALSSYTAQNYGAGNIQRITKGVRATFLISLCFYAVIATLLFSCTSQIIGLFVDNVAGADVIAVGAQFINITTPFYIVVLAKGIFDAVQRATGSAIFFASTTLVDLILRVAFAYILSPILGSTGIWWSWPIGWTVGTFMAAVFYFMGKWKKPNKKVFM